MSPKTNAEPAKEKLNSLFAPAPRKPNTELPTLERRTKKPSANCSPRPQAMVLSLIERRLVENSHARPRITAMPSIPVKRPIRSPFLCCSLSPLELSARNAGTNSLQMIDQPLRPAAIDIRLSNWVVGKMSAHWISKEFYGYAIVLQRME